MVTNTPSSADSRFEEEGDWLARQFFSAEDLEGTPEEYAARHAHLLACFSLHFYRYRDPVLGAWVRRLGEILATEGELDRCRHRYLTPEEFATVRKQEAEGY